MKYPFYVGDGRRQEPVQLPGGPQQLQLLKPEHYLPDEGLVNACNIALLLGKPLLLTGESGTGKTRFAYSLAWELGFDAPLTFETKSTSTPRDLFFTYDTFRQSQDAQSGSTGKSPLDYLTYQALGKAILLTKSPSEVQHILPPSFYHPGKRRSIVLIDEVDKAPRDFSNEILKELEYLYFRIPELGNLMIKGDLNLRPIVIITSNSEKDLPDSFLRRCVYYNIPVPTREHLKEIVINRLGLDSAESSDFLNDALDLFFNLRNNSVGKKPSVADLLWWMDALQGMSNTDNQLAQPERALKMLGSLLKGPESQTGDEIEGGMPMSEKYVDFELHIAPDGHTVANSIEGQATAQIPTEVPKNISLALKLIEKRETNADFLKEVGQTFYDWLFPGSLHTHFHQTEAVARRDNQKMRLRLRVEAEEIACLPLELLYRETGGYFVGINPNTVLSRYLNLPLPPERVRRREGPLHMLAIIADPTDQTRLPPDDWEVIINEALAVPLKTKQMTLQIVKLATRREIRNALLQQKPDIIQFVGHGIYQNGKGYLALVDEKTDKTWLVDDETFANLFLGYDDHLGLINLATCESAKSDDPQGFLGIAPKLVQRGVPAVLSMQYKVYIKTAKIFLEDFYTAIAARKPIDWATQSARNAVSQESGLDNREFATPVLYMRAKDGNVF